MSPVRRTILSMSKDGKKIKGKKKTIRKGTARKKSGARRNRSAKKTGIVSFGRLWRLALLFSGIFLGLLLPWAVFLNHQVTTKFEGHKWDLPSHVYARALELYLDKPISLMDLEFELGMAGYQRTTNAGRPGLYSVSGNTLKIYRRPFHFHDKAEDALKFLVQLQGGMVRGIRDLESGNSLDLVRLEPAEIAAIYPLQKEDRTLVRIEDVPPLLLTGLQAVEERARAELGLVKENETFIQIIETPPEQ